MALSGEALVSLLGPFAALVFFRLIMRAASIGVSVNDTSSETAIANAEVKPNDDMKRPTIPAMNPTGRNTASSDSVVAVTAIPISRVPSMAAWNGGIPFSSTKRKIFSSTTTASSITIPTISVSASIVIWFSVKPIAAISPKVATIEVGMAMAVMNVARKFQRKTKTTMAARILPSIR